MTAPTDPGIYDAIPDHVYHADRTSLSSSGARKLLLPSTPATFKHEQDNQRKPKKAFDFGHAAHTLVLGYGPKIVEIPEDVLASNGAVSTKEAKEFVATARAAGNVPLKPDEYAVVVAMAEKLKSHPIAAKLFESGSPEQSIYWTDKESGVRLRARPDWITRFANGRTAMVDFKSANSAAPADFARSAADYGYHQQQPWYCDGFAAVAADSNAAFLFVVQEKAAPYLVNVIELDREAVELGRRLNRLAIETYARCMESGIWPGYGNDVTRIELPQWAMYQQEELLNVNA